MNVLMPTTVQNNVISIAKSIAIERKNAKYSAAHILQALMHESIDFQDFLCSIGQDPSYIYEWADVRIEEYPKTTQPVSEVQADYSIQVLWENAEVIQQKFRLLDMSPLCILTSLVKPNTIFTSEQLKSLPLLESDLLMVLQKSRNNQDRKDGEMNGAGDVHQFNHLDILTLETYCIKLSGENSCNETNVCIGREREIRTIEEILRRKSKSNVIVVGEPGVGKTTLIKGVAQVLERKKLLSKHKNKGVFQLDLGLLAMGITHKGEIEDRLKKVVKACERIGGVLFIDEIHVLVDKKGSFSSLVSLLKTDLARGGITVIGTTTFEEYRKLIEPETAFNRRFEKVDILEPDDQTCIKMLINNVQTYEKYHGVRVDPEALPICVALAKRYAKDKKLPDTAFDLLDRTMAAIVLLNEMSVEEMSTWKRNYDHQKNNVLIEDQAKVDELIWLFSQLQHQISPILWGVLSEQPQLESSMELTKVQGIIESIYKELVVSLNRRKGHVSSVELAAVMAAKTGIPLGKIQVQEKEKLLMLEELLGHRVVGQQNALKVVSDAILESRSGLNKPGQPIGSFFFLGPTGTGKTELAKAIASLLFNDEKAMIRFDMSEFKEEHAAALLYGAPPGYVGYEEGGMLVNKIRQQPYTVVLFDEIEKAHPSVFDVFLQLMDEGKIHDKQGKVGDFSNALILFTSNIGSEYITTAFENHKIPSSKELMNWMKGHFRVEFLARITEIVPFAPVNETMAEQIFSIQVNSLFKTLERLQIAFEITPLAINKMAISGFTTEYGARQISGLIRQEITRPIAKMIVQEELVSGQKIVVDWERDNVTFQIYKPE